MASIKILRLQSELLKMFNTTIIYELGDSRLKSVYFSDMIISPDLTLAKVYFYSHDNDYTDKQLIRYLTKASGQFKKCIGNAKIMRIIPELRFYWDDSYNKSQKIESILKTIHSEEEE